MTTTTPTTVLLNVRTNQGYAPDQIERTISLGELLSQLEDAVEEFGEDAQVVVFGGKSYGADYGSIDTYQQVFEAVEADEEECMVCGFAATPEEYENHIETTGH